MMLTSQLARFSAGGAFRAAFAVAVSVFALAAYGAAPPTVPTNPPPLPPPPPLQLPGGATPGGAQPIVPPPSIPVPESNLNLNVPPVYERPLGAEEGARVFVKKFVITGVVGDRKEGINPAEIQAAVDARFADIEKLVEQERQKKENLEKQGPEGFTPDEQDKIIKFMSGAVKTQSAEEQQKQYQQFIQELMLERLQRLQGLTIGQLQQMADVVTKYYHDRGFFLARAVIPAQEIKDGVVNIRVLEGRLEKVVVSGNKKYSDKVLTEPFKPLIGDLVTVGRTENALLTMNRYPGLSAGGVFQPGSDVGTTDILVNVQNEKSFNGSVTADNSGTRFTGRNRLVGTVDWNNPTGAADLFQATLLHTFVPNNASFGDLRYQRPLFDAYDSFAADISRNSFDVSGTGSTAVGLGGVSKIATLSWEHDFERSREHNYIGTLDLSRKRADTTSKNFLDGVVISTSTVSRDDLAVIGYQLNFDALNTATNTLTTGYVRFEKGFAGILGVPSVTTLNTKGYLPSGSRTDSDSKVVSSNFRRLSGTYQLYKSLPDSQNLLFKVSAQYSPDPLTSLEQFVVGGPDSIRALPTSQFLTDSGAVGTIEYGVAAPGFAGKHAFGNYSWGQVLSFKVFLDSAIGYLNKDPVNSTKQVRATGPGIGLEFDIPGSLTSSLRYARLNGGARGTNSTDPTYVKDSSQVWVGITYSF